MTPADISPYWLVHRSCSSVEHLPCRKQRFSYGVQLLPPNDTVPAHESHHQRFHFAFPPISGVFSRVRVSHPTYILVTVHDPRQTQGPRDTRRRGTASQTHRHPERHTYEGSQGWYTVEASEDNLKLTVLKSAVAYSNTVLPTPGDKDKTSYSSVN